MMIISNLLQMTESYMVLDITDKKSGYRKSKVLCLVLH